MVRKLACFVTFALIVDSAAGNILNFNDLGEDGTGVTSFIGPYWQDDFLLSSSGLTFLYFERQHVNFYGATALFPENFGDQITLARSGGGTFSLESLDAAPFDPFIESPYALALEALRPDGSMILAYPMIAHGGGFSTLVFSEFTDVVSVSWKMDFTNFSQVTNISASVFSVPEIGGPGMLLTDLCLLALMRRRRISRSIV